MNLKARLKALEALAAQKAASAQQTSEKADLEAIQAQVAAIPTDQLLQEYEAMMASPLSPAIAARFEGKSAQELIQEYFQIIRGN